MSEIRNKDDLKSEKTEKRLTKKPSENDETEKKP